MNHTTRFALRLALSLADPATAEELAERLRPELLAVLADRFGLRKRMVEELLGGDAAQMRAALFIEPGEWLLGAAELGDPAVGRALWYAVFLDDEEERRRAMNNVPGLPATLLDAADLRDPRWYEDDGLFPVLCNERVGYSLVPLLTSGFPGVNVAGLAVFGVHLPRRSSWTPASASWSSGAAPNRSPSSWSCPRTYRPCKPVTHGCRNCCGRPSMPPTRSPS